MPPEESISPNPGDDRNKRIEDAARKDNQETENAPEDKPETANGSGQDEKTSLEESQTESLILGDVLKRVDEGDSEAAGAIYQKFAQRLIGLASTHIAKAFNSKFDPEDIVQSVFRSFFVRQNDGRLEFETWNDLWGFLARVTVLKCCENTRKFLADKRNLNREQSLNNLAPEGMSYEGISIEPSAYHVLVCKETVERLLDALRPIQCNMLKMRLDGHTNEEIAKQVKRSERSLYRLLSDLKDRAREILSSDETESGGESRADQKPGEQKPGEQKPGEQKPDEQHGSENNTQ